MFNNSWQVVSWCVILLNVHIVTSEKGDCTLSVRNDFSLPQPVFLKNGRLLLATDADGNIFLETGEGIIAACPGQDTYIKFGDERTKFNYVTVRCLSKNIFEYGEWIGPISNVRCNTEPEYTAELSGRACYGGNDIIRVGYKIDRVFYKMYEVCFNHVTSIAVYVTHELSIASYAYQRKVKRTAFKAGTFFNGIPMAAIYKKKNQQTRFNALFGRNMTAKYITNKEFLTRGHLAPRADFLFASWQRTTYQYINVAPQWLRNNMGNWESLEDSLRSRVSGSRGVLIYTGTYNVTTLKDAKGHERKAYLYSDKNNNPSVPVPMYFYKVVYDPYNKEGTAFVMINNPYYSLEKLKSLIFCEDICRGLLAPRWLRWRPDDPKRGYSFCCRIADFAETIGHLPKMDVQRMLTIYIKGI